MNEQLIDVNKKLTEEGKVINVVSSFNAIGMKINDWYRNFAVIGFVAGFILLYFYLIFKELDRILMRYEKSKI